MGTNEEKVAKKKKNKQKRKDWIKGILLIVVLFVIAGLVLYGYGYIMRNKNDVVNTTSVFDSIEKYGYSLNDNVTAYYKKEFDALKEIENEKDIASQVAKLFVIDLYSINYKINKYEVTSMQYFYSDKRDMHRQKVLDTIYRYVEDNSYGDRNQELPEVSEVIVKSEKEDTYKMGKDGKDKRNAYVVTLGISYVKDLGYDKLAEVILVKDGNNISVVSYDSM